MAGWSTTAMICLAMTGSLIDPRVIDVMPEKPVNGLRVSVILDISMVLPVSTRTLATSRSLITRSIMSGSLWGLSIPIVSYSSKVIVLFGTSRGEEQFALESRWGVWMNGVPSGLNHGIQSWGLFTLVVVSLDVSCPVIVVFVFTLEHS